MFVDSSESQAPTPVEGRTASRISGDQLSTGGGLFDCCSKQAADALYLLRETCFPSVELDDELAHRVCQTIREHVSPRHVPDDVIAAPSVPVTVTGKKLELPIKRILQGTAESKAVNRAAVANPDSLDWYIEFARRFREGPDTY